MITARSHPNIALIKYWGNRNEELRLPAADSLSMTLDHPSVEISLEAADAFSVRSLTESGEEKPLKEDALRRWRTHFDLTKKYLHSLKIPFPEAVSLEIRSGIPPSIGIASSAAVFSCAAEAYAGLAAEHRELSREEVSVIGRLGSGSASRSAYGGYSALLAGTGGKIDAAKSIQIAPEDHWVLHDVIVVPSTDAKKVGSTEGHALAGTSPHFAARVADIPRRQEECMGAILAKDFSRLRAVAEHDALDMHHVMETSNPPLRYLTDATHRILQEIEELRTREHLEVLYTMDAGPTVHLLCTEAALPTVRAFAETQKEQGCAVFEAKTGRGSRLV